MAYLLRGSYGSSLHRNASLEQGTQRSGHLEGDGISFPHPETAAQGAGLLEECLWRRPAGGGLRTRPRTTQRLNVPGFGYNRGLVRPEISEHREGNYADRYRHAPDGRVHL